MRCSIRAVHLKRFILVVVDTASSKTSNFPVDTTENYGRIEAKFSRLPPNLASIFFFFVARMKESVYKQFRQYWKEEILHTLAYFNSRMKIRDATSLWVRGGWGKYVEGEKKMIRREMNLLLSLSAIRVGTQYHVHSTWCYLRAQKCKNYVSICRRIRSSPIVPCHFFSIIRSCWFLNRL
jgi:hypothetical protein